MDEKIVQTTMEALKRNNVEVELVATGEEAKVRALDVIGEGATIGLGGSTSVSQIGLLSALREGNYDLIDAYEEGIERDEGVARRRKGLLVEYFITGTNAITEKGELVNVDGFGNRVAGQIFGPEKVIIVASTNKIVKDVHAGIKRIREIAAPLNAKRFNMDPPCTTNGSCESCTPEKTLCNVLTVISRQVTPGRMRIILVEEELGF